MPELIHCSYLVRLWREHGEQPWRITLIAVADPNERHHFSTLAECFAFLQAQTATPEQASTGDEGAGSSGTQLEAAGPEKQKGNAIVAQPE
jgi:hypothetical protein